MGIETLSPRQDSTTYKQLKSYRFGERQILFGLQFYLKNFNPIKVAVHYLCAGVQSVNLNYIAIKISLRKLFKHAVNREIHRSGRYPLESENLQ